MPRWGNIRNNIPEIHGEDLDYSPNLKDFLTTSSNLLINKKSKLRSSREGVQKTKILKNKNINFYPNKIMYTNQGNRFKRIYKNPQSTKRQNMKIKSQNITESNAVYS